jgi:ribosomal protein S18 acetylase RimI-like enzyme
MAAAISASIVLRRHSRVERQVIKGDKDMEQKAEIGPANPEDFHAIRELCNSFLDWCRSRYGENAWFVDHYYTPERWAALLDSLPMVHAVPDGAALVARLDGKVVGCVMMQRIDDRTCEMKRMFVGPEGRGLGLGRHDEALGLYRALGFREIDPYYEAPPELGNHLIFMETALQ